MTTSPTPRWRIAVVTLVVAASLFSGLYALATATRDQQDFFAEQSAGRALVIQVNCALFSAVIDAGRKTIVNGTSMPNQKQEVALKKLGFPPFAVRRKQAALAADRYAAGIARAVADQVGNRAVGLVRKDGTLRCERLATIANTP